MRCATVKIMELRAFRKSASWSINVLRIWTILWMLAVPAFHVHPDIEHQHGESSHVHGGTFHTVFVPDLVSESGYQHEHDSYGHSAAGDFSLSDRPPHSSDTVQLEFSFISNSTERKLVKLAFIPIFTAQLSGNLELVPRLSVVQPRAITPAPLFMIRHIPSRAPPPHSV